MKRTIIFKENGNEYSGSLTIDCDTLEQIDSKTFKVNGAIIEIDEDIISIT